MIGDETYYRVLRIRKQEKMGKFDFFWKKMAIIGKFVVSLHSEKKYI